MRLVMGGVNGHYLQNITLNCVGETEEVLAAVAYATDGSLLFDWCWEHRIPLKFYGRLDDSVPVTVRILEDFLTRRSPDYVCRLVQHHHAKVIWWRGVGAYIGSANLTDSAWSKNVEAGCFLSEEELDYETMTDLENLFETLDAHATPLTEELFKEMKKRSDALNATRPNPRQFWESPSFNKWPGLVRTSPQNATDRKRNAFLKEWHSTLQILRDIAARVVMPENRPPWISDSASAGAQADQFLHAHYYQHTFDGQRADYASHFEKNRTRCEETLIDTLHWWHRLPDAPSGEDEMLDVTAPFLRLALAEDQVLNMSYEQFRKICMGVHAIKDYARRVPNAKVGIADGRPYTIPEKVAALSRRIWNDSESNGTRVRQLVHNILYGGTEENLPERLWQTIADSNWKIDGLGISGLGELVGWALPDRFPPRNGRTSKALRSLGFDVKVHVE